MSFLAFCIVPLIFLSLIVRGLQPSVIRATNRRHSNERHTTSIGHGHFRRDLRQTTVISNDESTDGEIPCDNVFERKGPIESEADFVSYCEDWLLFFEKDRSNAFVSQGDLVDFLADVCTVFDEEDLPYFDCPAPTFTSIDQDVQIVFVKHLCGLKVGEEMVQCLKSIVDAGTEFGYHVDLTRSPLMEELCCGLIPFVSLVGLRQSTACPNIPNNVPTNPSFVPAPSSIGSEPTLSSGPMDGTGPNPSPAVTTPSAPSIAGPGTIPTTIVVGPTPPSRPTNGPANTPTATSPSISGPGSSPIVPSRPISGPGFTPTTPSKPINGPGTTPTQPSQPVNGPGTTPSTPSQPANGPDSTPTQPTQPVNRPSSTPSTPSQTVNGPDSTPAPPSQPVNGPGSTPSTPSQPVSGPGSTPTQSSQPANGPGSNPTQSSQPANGPGSTPTQVSQPANGPGTTPTRPSPPISGPGTTPLTPSQPISGPGMTPTVSSQPINGPGATPTAPSIPISGPGTTPIPPSRPMSGPGTAPSLAPTRFNGPRLPSQVSEPTPTMPAIPSAPQVRPSLSPSPLATRFPGQSQGPSKRPLQKGEEPIEGSPVDSNEQAARTNTGNAENSVSVAAIAGISLGLGGLCIMGIVSTRRRARKREEAELSDSTPMESDN